MVKKKRFFIVLLAEENEMTKRDKLLIKELREQIANERERRVKVENKMEDLRDFLAWLLQDVFEFRKGEE